MGQLVGLKMNCSRSRVIVSYRLDREDTQDTGVSNRTTQTAVTCPSVGLMTKTVRTTTFPRSNGPVTAGRITVRPAGPLYGLAISAAAE